MSMRVSIFGMGYVGCTLAACLASDGHSILGVEPNERRAEAIRAGRLPFVEEELSALFDKYRARVSVEDDPAAAVAVSDVTFICVGTPRRDDDAGFDLRSLRCAAEQVGEGLGRKAGYHTVIIKSTVMPGTMRRVVKPILEAKSGKRADVDFGLLFNPEFLREGSAVKDFYGPPLTVVGGELSPASRAALRELYDWVRAPWVETDFETAEMLKLTCNAFHALKVCFANEIGNLCRAEGIDSQAVMDIFVRDIRLNISSAYLKPGFAFGGACLPKDVGVLNDLADVNDLATPVLRSILPSNDDQIEMARLAVSKLNPKSVGIVGLAASRKPTNDFRGSPGMRLAALLRRDGYEVRAYDPQMPGEDSLAETLACDVVVLASRAVGPELLKGRLAPATGGALAVIDLVGALPDGNAPYSIVRLV